MELLTFLRALTRRRLLLALGVIAAAASGATAYDAAGRRAAADRSPAGFAQADVLVDTRRSQTIDLRGGAEELELQAMLLAALLADDPQTLAIAREARVPWAGLEVVVHMVTEPIAPTRLARSLAEAGPRTSPYRVTVRPLGTTPIVRLRATAPSRAQAVELARAARTQLALLAAESAPGPHRRLRAEPLGEVRFLPVAPAGVPAPLAGGLAGSLVFAIWCYVVVLGQRAFAARRRLRTSPAPPAYTP